MRCSSSSSRVRSFWSRLTTDCISVFGMVQSYHSKIGPTGETSRSRQQPARLSQMSDSFRKALFTSVVVGFALPAHVLLIQDDFLAGNPHHTPVPQYDHGLFIASLLDPCDARTEHCHAVALFQGALPLAADVVFLACLN